MLYRAYLMEDRHVCTAVSSSSSDDEDARRQIENLLDRRDIELWQGRSFSSASISTSQA
jgi:hypothetical protein